MTRRSPGGIYLANKNDRKRFKKGKNDGRYRSPYSKDQRSADRASGGTGGDDPNVVASGGPVTTFRGVPIHTVADIDPADLHPGGITFLDAAKVMQDIIDQQIFSTMIYGRGPVFIGHDVSGKPRRPDLKREMKVGEIIAYRCWRYANGILQSVYMKDLWEPDCVHIGRELEDWGERGIHAWKEPNSPEFSEYVRGYLADSRDPWFRKDDTVPTMITGSVFLWGDVVEHEHGYRAEFAKVRSIDWVFPNASDMGNAQRILDELRGTYHV